MHTHFNNRIPDWFLAIDNALRILKPGGIIAVVDFYVSRYSSTANPFFSNLFN